jgi:hypothetical protein
LFGTVGRFDLDHRRVGLDDGAFFSDHGGDSYDGGFDSYDGGDFYDGGFDSYDRGDLHDDRVDCYDGGSALHDDQRRRHGRRRGGN